jgi:hypothetical protein
MQHIPPPSRLSLFTEDGVAALSTKIFVDRVSRGTMSEDEAEDVTDPELVDWSASLACTCAVRFLVFPGPMPYRQEHGKSIP